MKKLKYAEVRDEGLVFEELRPRVKYKEILKPEDDWVPEEKYSPPTVNGVLSNEHRNHG
jgi:hypothetical protein